jgi:hypothetical protein
MSLTPNVLWLTLEQCNMNRSIVFLLSVQVHIHLPCITLTFLCISIFPSAEFQMAPPLPQCTHIHAHTHTYTHLWDPHANENGVTRKTESLGSKLSNLRHKWDCREAKILSFFLFWISQLTFWGSPLMKPSLPKDMTIFIVIIIIISHVSEVRNWGSKRQSNLLSIS